MGLAVAGNCRAVHVLMAADTSGVDVLLVESEHAAATRAAAAAASNRAGLFRIGLTWVIGWFLRGGLLRQWIDSYELQVTCGR
jgi:hypothetical protein